MKRVIYVALILSVFVLLGNVSTAWSTSIGTEPALWPGSQQSKITAGSKNLISVIGYKALIIAINGNQITMQNLTDASKTATVTVNNAALFRVGQQVDLSERLLTPH
jgi:hypothetical protein